MGNTSVMECTGLEALYLSALDSGASLITGVPGYPITTLMELFLSGANERRENEKPPEFEAKWLTNEKVALEMALGASAAGRRALVIVKHVGMNLLSDPLITSVTHTIGAGLVIIAGDDPGVKGSQNEQDSRWYGKLAEVAVFDPHDPDTAYRALRRAYELSEETKVPVILRVTAGLEKSRGEINRFPPSEKVHPEFDHSAWELRMREKHRYFHANVYPLLEAEAENTDLNSLQPGREVFFEDLEQEREQKREREQEREQKREKEQEREREETRARYGIISSGFASTLVKEVLCRQPHKHSEISHLSLNLVNPLPYQKIGAFLESQTRVLVVEESEPFIEEQLCISGKVCGKKTGHLPYGQLLVEDIEFALENLKKNSVEKPVDPAAGKARKKSRTSICEDCSFLPLYHILRELDVRVAGDMGCSIRSAPEPLSAVDVSFALGSAISVACGFEKKGIAVIGDFALAHSGILGLLNAVHSGEDVLVLVLENEVAAMTGGQEVPGLKPVVEAIVPDVLVYDFEERIKGKEMEKTWTELSDLIEEKTHHPGVCVIFIRGKCARYS